MSNLERTRAYLRGFSLRDGSSFSYYADDVVQRELPNRLVPEGRINDLAAMKIGAERGKKAVARESYEVLKMIEMGDEVAVECLWTATLNVPLGKLAAGDTMTAHLAMFITWRDGKIVSQRNYDCFEPF